jgi:hypothetical protein
MLIDEEEFIKVTNVA